MEKNGFDNFEVVNGPGGIKGVVGYRAVGYSPKEAHKAFESFFGEFINNISELYRKAKGVDLDECKELIDSFNDGWKNLIGAIEAVLRLDDTTSDFAKMIFEINNRNVQNKRKKFLLYYIDKDSEKYLVTVKSGLKGLNVKILKEEKIEVNSNEGFRVTDNTGENDGNSNTGNLNWNFVWKDGYDACNEMIELLNKIRNHRGNNLKWLITSRILPTLSNIFQSLSSITFYVDLE